jgi:hypothetical protein
MRSRAIRTAMRRGRRPLHRRDFFFGQAIALQNWSVVIVSAVRAFGYTDRMGERAFIERRNPRADVSLSATYQWAHEDERRTGWVVNIGVGGLRLVADDDGLGVDGTQVVVALPLPRVGREMLLRGAVVSLTRAGDGTCGFSVAFQQIDPGDREAIGFLVATGGA